MGFNSGFKGLNSTIPNLNKICENGHGIHGIFTLWPYVKYVSVVNDLPATNYRTNNLSSIEQ